MIEIPRTLIDGRSARNTVDTTLTLDQLRDMIGVFIHPTTGRPLFLDPQLIGPDGRANPAFFQNPTAGKYGSLQLTPIDGPVIGTSMLDSSNEPG